MSTFKNLDDARKYFEEERFATENGMVIDELYEDYCVCSMEIKDYHRNALHGVMGGAIFTLADFAFAVATNHKAPGTVSLTSDISFIGVPKGERLIAETEFIKEGRTTCCYTVRVTDELGNITSVVKIVGYKKQ